MEDKIYEKMLQFTGRYREYSDNKNKKTNKIYGSYHFDNFNKINAIRNTLVRFHEFLVPDNLSGKKVFDFGCCLGALGFECIRRNALNVIGFEYCKERIDI